MTSPFEVGVGAGVPLLTGDEECILMWRFKLTFLSALYEQYVQAYCLPAGRGVFASLLDSSAAGSDEALGPSVGFGSLFEQ